MRRGRVKTGRRTKFGREVHVQGEKSADGAG